MLRASWNYGVRFIVATLLATAPWIAWGEDNADTVLTGKGLKKVGAVYALPDESQIEDRLKEAQKMKATKVFAAQKEANAAEQQIETLKKKLEDGKKYMDNLEVEMAKTNSASRYNQMRAELIKTDKLMENFDKQLDETRKQVKDKRTAAMQAVETYSEHLLQTRRAYDKVTQQYKVLASDKEITEAIGKLNADGPKPPIKLGPTPVFTANGAKLKGIEDKIFSESIPMRKGDGGLWNVSVVFGGKPAIEMEVDTGSSSVLLPWKHAKELSLEPPADAPIVRSQLANGQIVQGKRVVAPKIRVGQFEVENVECTVFGPEYPEASPLLGQSFLSHFVFKIDNAAGKLIMTKLDSPDDKTPSKPKGK